MHLYEGDCNAVLIEKVFPHVRFEEYRRALCLLDPYGLHLNWEVVEAAGKMQSIEIFLNFPVMDMNRNVLWRHPENVDENQILRMNAYWGDDSWREIAYKIIPGLFGPMEEKLNGEVVAYAYRERLCKVAGFGHVTKPLPMRNSKGAVVYYLFFASQKAVAIEIVRDIFDKYRERGVM